MQICKYADSKCVNIHSGNPGIDKLAIICKWAIGGFGECVQLQIGCLLYVNMQICK